MIELYRSNEVEELSQVLQEYLLAAISYSKKGLGLCFDKQIF